MEKYSSQNIVTCSGRSVNLWCATIATLPHKNLDYLLSTCEKNNVNMSVLGWGDGRIQSKKVGYGLKLHYIREHVKQLVEEGHGEDPLLIVDGYDVLLCGGLEEVLQVYARYNVDLLFSGEPYMPWVTDSRKNKHYKYLPESSSGPYPHLCSGVFIGKIRVIYDLLEQNYYDIKTDDQDYWISLIGTPLNSLVTRENNRIEPVGSIQVDRWGYLCSNLHGCLTQVSFDERQGQFYNSKSRCFTPILHFGSPFLKGFVKKYHNVYMEEDSTFSLLDPKFKVASLIFILILFGVLFALLMRKKTKCGFFVFGGSYSYNVIL